MHKSLQNIRFSIKPQKVESNRPTELARTMSIHPLTYQELPYDPEYSHYAGRLTTEKLSKMSSIYNCIIHYHCSKLRKVLAFLKI